jgi:hypothetical protein
MFLQLLIIFCIIININSLLLLPSIINKINAKISNKYEIDNLCHEDIQTSLYNYLCYCNMPFNKIKKYIG